MVKKISLVIPFLFLVFLLLPIKAYAHTLAGTVFVDTNTNGVQDNGENGYPGATVTAVGQGGETYSWTTDANGQYGDRTHYLQQDTYTITLTLPSGYVSTTTNPVTLVIEPKNYTVNFGIAAEVPPSFTLLPAPISAADMPHCTTDESCGNACTAPPNTCNTNNGQLGCTYDQPAACSVTSFTKACTINNCNPNTICYQSVCTPVYTISGNVFNDINKNRLKDNSEINYPATPTISVTGGAVNNGTATTNSDGTFTISNLFAGTYLVSYTSPLPNGYLLIYPKNGPPPAFLVTVGSGCTVDGTSGATCDGQGNITNLNFAISNSIPWMQMYDGDIRIDTGITDKIPATPDPLYGPYADTVDTSANTPGILFTGDASYDFGQGSASTTNWLAGGLIYPEVFSFSQSGELSTFYQSLLSKAQRTGITPTDVTSINECSNLANCSLPPSIQSGVYIANGDTTLTGAQVNGNRNILLLVNGTLTISGAITVDQTSTALFSAAQDITIDTGVHAPTDTAPVPSGQLQGFFVAGRNFTVQGINNCVIGKDTMLNAEGSIVTNARGQGGSFTNNRDLCGDNPSYPSFTIKTRPDFLLNAPSLLMQPGHNITQEVAP